MIEEAITESNKVVRVKNTDSNGEKINEERRGRRDEEERLKIVNWRRNEGMWGIERDISEGSGGGGDRVAGL